MLHATGKPSTAAMQYVHLGQRLDASLVGELMVAGAELAQHQQTVWLRLPASQEGSQELLRKLPGPHYHDVQLQAETSEETTSGGRLLRRPGQQVPTARLPQDLLWQTIDKHFEFVLPTPGIGSQSDLLDRPPLRLQRGGNQRTAAALLVSLSHLAAWVDTAATVRMQPLRWLCRSDQALVLGTPLPPLDGTLLAACDRVLLPLGFRWQPALPASAVLEAFRAAADATAEHVLQSPLPRRAANSGGEDEGEGQHQQSQVRRSRPATAPRDAWLIWESDLQWCLIDDGDWVSLTRASVRAALEKR